MSAAASIMRRRRIEFYRNGLTSRGLSRQNTQRRSALLDLMRELPEPFDVHQVEEAAAKVFPGSSGTGSIHHYLRNWARVGWLKLVTPAKAFVRAATYQRTKRFPRCQSPMERPDADLALSDCERRWREFRATIAADCGD